MFMSDEHPWHVAFQLFSWVMPVLIDATCWATHIGGSTCCCTMHINFVHKPERKTDVYKLSVNSMTALFLLLFSVRMRQLYVTTIQKYLWLFHEQVDLVWKQFPNSQHPKTSH